MSALVGVKVSPSSRTIARGAVAYGGIVSLQSAPLPGIEGVSVSRRVLLIGGRLNQMFRCAASGFQAVPHELLYVFLQESYIVTAAAA